jgi:predicted regulator of amino acid metabolism with ACT domain
MEDRRKKAHKLYKELVKRGQKVEKNARVALKDIELPRLELDSLTDRKKLDKQLKKVRSRFAELRETVGLKSAA